jgi:hypothetical protein
MPRFDEDWSPIFNSLRAGDFFVSTGEILIPGFSVEGEGAQPTVRANVKWTFPLEFIEMARGGGKTIGNKVVSATELAPFWGKGVHGSLRRRRQEVGSFRGLGFGGERGVYATVSLEVGEKGESTTFPPPMPGDGFAGGRFERRVSIVRRDRSESQALLRRSA